MLENKGRGGASFYARIRHCTATAHSPLSNQLDAQLNSLHTKAGAQTSMDRGKHIRTRLSIVTEFLNIFSKSGECLEAKGRNRLMVNWEFRANFRALSS